MSRYFMAQFAVFDVTWIKYGADNKRGCGCTYSYYRPQIPMTSTLHLATCPSHPPESSDSVLIATEHILPLLFFYLCAPFPETHHTKGVIGAVVKQGAYSQYPVTYSQRPACSAAHNEAVAPYNGVTVNSINHRVNEFSKIS